LVKFGHVVSEIREMTDRQINGPAHRNSSVHYRTDHFVVQVLQSSDACVCVFICTTTVEWNGHWRRHL